MADYSYTNTIPVRAFIDARGRAAVMAYLGGHGTGISPEGAGPWRADDHPVAAGGEWSSFPTADMDDAGNLVVTWVDSDDFSGDDESIFWRTPSGDWSFQSGGGGGNYDLVAHDGTATITRNDSDGLYVQTSRIGERSATPWRTLRPGNIGYTPIIEGNARGDLVLVAVEGEDPSSGVLSRRSRSSRRDDQGRRAGLGRRFGRHSGDRHRPPGGRDRARRPDRGDLPTLLRRRARRGHRPGRRGGTDRPRPTGGAHSGKAPPSAAISPAGEVLVTWSTAKGSVRVAKRSTAGTWTSLGRLRGDILGGHMVRAYPNGMFTALHLDAGALWWSDYVDASTGPRTVMRAPSRDSSNTRSIPVRWHMTDALSRPASADSASAADGPEADSQPGRSGSGRPPPRRPPSAAGPPAYCFSGPRTRPGRQHRPLEREPLHTPPPVADPALQAADVAARTRRRPAAVTTGTQPSSDHAGSGSGTVSSTRSGDATILRFRVGEQFNR